MALSVGINHSFCAKLAAYGFSRFDFDRWLVFVFGLVGLWLDSAIAHQIFLGLCSLDGPTDFECHGLPHLDKPFSYGRMLTRVPTIKVFCKWGNVYVLFSIPTDFPLFSAHLHLLGDSELNPLPHSGPSVEIMRLVTGATSTLRGSFLPAEIIRVRWRAWAQNQIAHSSVWRPDLSQPQTDQFRPPC